MVQAETAPLKQPVEHASAEDCAVFAALGKQHLHWDSEPPEQDMFPVFNTKDGGSYVEDCPWKALGLSEPNIGNPSSRSGFYFSRPEFSLRGIKASLTYSYFIKSDRTEDGKEYAPFVAQYRCVLRKSIGRWQLINCKLGAIT